MIILKPIDEKTYEEFFVKMVKLYAEESITAGRWNEDNALELAREESTKLLPKKDKTKDNYLFNIMNDSKVVGYIWAGCNDPKRNEVFIYAFEISEEYRGKGFGKKGFSLMEEELKKLGFSIIKLHVFEQSKVAINLYNSVGYKQVSRIMKKGM